jgi:type I pantothenate kinase
MTGERSAPSALYHVFSRVEWAALRHGVPLPLSDADVQALRGLNEPVSLDEVLEVYPRR